MRGRKTKLQLLIEQGLSEKANHMGFYVVKFKPYRDSRAQNGEDLLGYDPRHIFSSLENGFSNGVFPFKTTNELIEMYDLWSNISLMMHGDRNKEQGLPRLVIQVDECQFAPDDYVKFIEKVKKDGHSVVINSFLDKSFRGEPFSPMIEQLSENPFFNVKLRALCDKEFEGVLCNKPAEYSQRLIEGKPAHYASPLIVVGGTDNYIPVDLNCLEIPGKLEADFIRNHSPGINVQELYDLVVSEGLNLHHAQADLYRMEKEGTVIITNAKRGEPISSIPLFGKTLLGLESDGQTLEKDKGIIVSGRIMEYKGVQQYAIDGFVG